LLIRCGFFLQVSLAPLAAPFRCSSQEWASFGEECSLPAAGQDLGYPNGLPATRSPGMDDVAYVTARADDMDITSPGFDAPQELDAFLGSMNLEKVLSGNDEEF
jgi:hypothetical protein